MRANSWAIVMVLRRRQASCLRGFMSGLRVLSFRGRGDSGCKELDGILKAQAGEVLSPAWKLASYGAHGSDYFSLSFSTTERNGEPANVQSFTVELTLQTLESIAHARTHANFHNSVRSFNDVDVIPTGMELAIGESRITGGRWAALHLGHLFCFGLNPVTQRQQSLSQRVSGLGCSSIDQIAHSPLTAPARGGYLGLRQVAVFLNFGNDDFPVHGIIITASRYFTSGFLLSVSPRL